MLTLQLLSFNQSFFKIKIVYHLNFRRIFFFDFTICTNFTIIENYLKDKIILPMFFQNKLLVGVIFGILVYEGRGELSKRSQIAFLDRKTESLKEWYSSSNVSYNFCKFFFSRTTTNDVQAFQVIHRCKHLRILLTEFLIFFKSQFQEAEITT